MWAFEFLGIDLNADKRAIKSAYAKCLKKMRPDEDPTGFQKLHEAYQTALNFALKDITTAADNGLSYEPLDVYYEPTIQSNAYGKITIEETPFTDCKADVVHEELSKPLNSSQNNPSLPPDLTIIEPYNTTMLNDIFPEKTNYQFDFDDFYNTLLTTSAKNDQELLMAWLENIPELWSLNLKETTGHHLMDKLDENPAPLHKELFDSILTFFGFDDIHAPINQYFLWDLRNQLHKLWQTEAIKITWHDPFFLFFKKKLQAEEALVTGSKIMVISGLSLLILSIISLITYSYSLFFSYRKIFLEIGTATLIILALPAVVWYALWVSTPHNQFKSRFIQWFAIAWIPLLSTASLAIKLFGGLSKLSNGIIIFSLFSVVFCYISHRSIIQRHIKKDNLSIMLLILFGLVFMQFFDPSLQISETKYWMFLVSTLIIWLIDKISVG